MKRAFLTAIAFLTFASPAWADISSPPVQKVYETDILNNHGQIIGSLTLTQGTEGVVVRLKARMLPPGFHGMHFHEVGDCSDHHTFTKSGAHIDPFKKPHGFLNPKGPHEGNLPNLIIGKDGRVEVELYSHMVSLVPGKTNLLDEDGSALIIHTDRDDHFTQPIGGSGARIACAVISHDADTNEDAE